MYCVFFKGFKSKFLGLNPRARILSESTGLAMGSKISVAGYAAFLVMGIF